MDVRCAACLSFDVLAWCLEFPRAPTPSHPPTGAARPQNPLATHSHTPPILSSVQFCLLEPELLCRLVYVKDVECQPPGTPPLPVTVATAAAAAGEAASAAAAAATQQGAQQGAAGQQGEQGGGLRAPPGTTELPTCPVCLERLDEHISGIVTTVRLLLQVIQGVQTGACGLELRESTSAALPRRWVFVWFAALFGRVDGCTAGATEGLDEHMSSITTHPPTHPL